MNSRPKVYYIKEITEQNMIKMYNTIGKSLPPKVCVKVHSGEPGGDLFLRPQFLKPLVDYVDGTIVECNTAYVGKVGSRNTTETHKKTMTDHGWYGTFGKDRVVIMDEDEDVEKDKVLEIPDGFKIKKNYVGNKIENFKSMLVCARFKGHSMGGYGGALKQLSIGCGSSAGKTYQHTGGRTTDQYKMDEYLAEQDDFLDSMADAATSVVRHFNGNMAFINVMTNISFYCDCAWFHQEKLIDDMGIMGSDDPVAVDQACMDMLLSNPDPGKKPLINEINTLHGVRTIKRAEEHGIGRRDYQLIVIK